MENSKNKAARLYLRQIRRLLPCSQKVKDEITAPLRSSLDEFIAERPEADAEALRARFGTPETIAVTCLENANMADVLCQLHTKRKIMTIIFTAVLIVLLTWGAVLLHTYLELKKGVLSGYTVSEIHSYGAAVESTPTYSHE